MKTIKKVSIVIPVYNEQHLIKKTIQKVLDARTPKLKWEIVIIDDGSSDNTPAIIKSYQKQKDFVIILNKENQGKGAVLKEALTKTTGDIVIIQDADLEYDPADYPQMLLPFLKNEADVVYGSRLTTAAPHRVLYFWHYMANKALTLLSNLMTNLNLTDMETGYKAFRGDIIRKIAPKLKSKRFGFEPEVTARISKESRLKIFEVGISYSGRTYEEGKKIGWKDGVRAIWEILKYNIQD